MEAAGQTIHLSACSTDPVYNVKAVCRRTGIAAATLRAWERRYNFPAPNRTANGYRLYSERDIALLSWLHEQTAAGISIGQAIHQMNHLLANGRDLTIRMPATSSGVLASGPRAPHTMALELSEALADLDERQAEHLLAEAMALYTLETTLIDVLRQALHLIPVKREQHIVPLMIERYAQSYARKHLLNLIQSTPSTRNARAVITIGFPGEHNELDLLIIGLLLRRNGWGVLHLGTDLDPAMLRSTLDHMDPAAVLYYTDHPRHAARLADFDPPIDGAGQPVWCVCAGQALQLVQEMQKTIPFEYLGADMRGALKRLVAGLRERQLSAHAGQGAPD
jgi:DNA-binding transcriptional MerR regulator